MRRNIPPERENSNDRFRVNFGDSSLFDLLEVTICRAFTGQEIVYEFDASNLMNRNSIHFTTYIETLKMVVEWDDFITDKALLR